MAGRAGAGKVAAIIAVHVAKGLWVSLMVLTPLFGFWLASSLAAYHNATQWLALLIGALLFPILPVGWELFAAWRTKKKLAASKSKAPPKPAILTRLDRLVLRTLVINGVFLALMMWQARTASFRALAVRGDWMLDGYNGAVASTLRGWMLGFADRFDRRTTKVDPTYGEGDDAPDDVKPNEDPWRPTPDVPVDPTKPPEPVRHDGTWPMTTELHPYVVAMPESEQTSVAAVGAYFAARITNKRELVKALHDYAINRLHYDYDALKLIEAHDYKNVPEQTADAVFARKAGVCEGYARLMVALGEAAGVEIAYVTGYIRDTERRLSISDDPWDTSQREALEGVGHAWNAVKLDDGWHLMDATWDDPTNSDTTTTYLFVPPSLMAFDHYPEDAKWQLLEKPLSLGDFVRQPMLAPAIGEMGLTLISPNRSQVTVDGTVQIVLDNPKGAVLKGTALKAGGKSKEDSLACKVEKGVRTTITCDLPEGEYEVHMFATPEANTRGTGGYTLDYIGTILVNSH